jgi:hypothetical protein
VHTEKSVCPTYINQPRMYQPSRACSFIQNKTNKITKAVIYYLSAKQAMRPDSFAEICVNIIPKVSNVLFLQCWKLRSLFKTSIKIALFYFCEQIASFAFSQEDSRDAS